MLEELRVDGRLPLAFWVGAGLKAGLVLLLLLPLGLPELEQYEGKGMSWRALVFPLAGLIVPVLWRAADARPPYPYLADNLLVLPPITDVLWNTLDAYDRVAWWDDANHLVNSMLFAAVIGLLAGRAPLSAAVRFGLALGLGMTLQVLWELGEYAVFVTELSTVENAYEDTIGDLALDLLGALFGAAFALFAVRTAEEEAREAATAFAGR
ncbi:MAG TPA: hypothetical protein VNJ53_11970 [Gaiellaceae bacterium]|nr:hypothetical protein [Gaiellaceae bacterium]